MAGSEGGVARGGVLRAHPGFPRVKAESHPEHVAGLSSQEGGNEVQVLGQEDFFGGIDTLNNLSIS